MMWCTPEKTFDPQCIVPTVEIQLQCGDVLHIEESESCIFLIEQWTDFY